MKGYFFKAVQQMVTRDVSYATMSTEQVFYLLRRDEETKTIYLCTKQFTYRPTSLAEAPSHRALIVLAYHMYCAFLIPPPIPLLVSSTASLSTELRMDNRSFEREGEDGAENRQSTKTALTGRRSSGDGGDATMTETHALSDTVFKRPLLSSVLTPAPRRVLLSALSSDGIVGANVRLTDWSAHRTKRIYVGLDWRGSGRPFLLKLAAPGYTADRLRDEFNVLGILADLPAGVPTVHGLFKWLGARDDRLVLAVSYCGRPAQSWRNLSLDQR
jgi:hypothetical protein